MMGFGNALYDSPACQVHCAGHFDCSTTFGCDGCGHYCDCVDDGDGDAVWRRSASFATLSNRMTTTTTSTSATSIATTTNVTVTVASGAFTASFTTTAATVHRSC